MRAWIIGWCVLGALGAAQAQQVWRCQQGEQVRYSDQPCPQTGQPVPARSLQPNLSDPVRPPTAPASAAAPPPVAAAPAWRNACPGDAEIRGMETRAGSTTLDPEARQFMQDEVRRARQCQKGHGRYSEADWQISREAQAAQSNLKGAYEARLRAESMHGAADPDEGERIFRRSLAQARLLRQQQLQGQNPQPQQPR